MNRVQGRYRFIHRTFQEHLAIKWLDREIAQEPENVALLTWRSELHENAGNIGSAINDLNVVIGLWLRDAYASLLSSRAEVIREPRLALADQYHRRGKLHYRKKDWQSSRRFRRRGFTADFGHERLGWCHQTSCRNRYR